VDIEHIGRLVNGPTRHADSLAYLVAGFGFFALWKV
jgi:hypothetical protein